MHSLSALDWLALAAFVACWTAYSTLAFGAQPLLAAPDAALWEMKVALLLLICVRAFFELTWALRQFNCCSIVMGGIPQDPAAAQGRPPRRR